MSCRANGLMKWKRPEPDDIIGEYSAEIAICHCFGFKKMKIGTGVICLPGLAANRRDATSAVCAGPSL